MDNKQFSLWLVDNEIRIKDLASLLGVTERTISNYRTNRFPKWFSLALDGLTRKQVKNPKTKGDHAALLEASGEFLAVDCALPMHFLQVADQRGFGNVSSHFVFVYPVDGAPYPYPITEQGKRIAATLAATIAPVRG